MLAWARHSPAAVGGGGRRRHMVGRFLTILPTARTANSFASEAPERVVHLNVGPALRDEAAPHREMPANFLQCNAAHKQRN